VFGGIVGGIATKVRLVTTDTGCIESLNLNRQ